MVQDRLRPGSRMPPPLREPPRPDGSRIAVLDFIVQVPKAPLPAWSTVERLIGFDWGVNTLITAVVLDAQGQQISRPFFLRACGLDGHQARTRRQIDQLKAKRETLPENNPPRARSEQEITRCSRLYATR